MRLIIRNERPHPGAQLRITDAEGLRLTCFATNTVRMPIAELELRHRRRARCEDRIRDAVTALLHREVSLRRPRHRPAQTAPSNTKQKRSVGKNRRTVMQDRGERSPWTQ